MPCCPVLRGFPFFARASSPAFFIWAASAQALALIIDGERLDTGPGAKDTPSFSFCMCARSSGEYSFLAVFGFLLFIEGSVAEEGLSVSACVCGP